MARSESAPLMPRLITLAAMVVITVALYLGRDVLMPLALGVLFSFLLAPLVTRLERAGIGRIPSVILVTLLSFAVLGSVAYLVVREVYDLTTALPAYRDNIHHRLETIRGQHGPIAEVTRSLEELKNEIAPSSPAVPPIPGLRPSPTAETGAPPPGPATPVPVVIAPAKPTSFTDLGSTLSELIWPLGMAAVVIVLVVYILIQREDLRDRIIFLLGRGRIHLTTQALDDASQRISRYLLMQLIINVSYGVPVAAVLYWLGLPNALVFGLLAALLRYLPYVGPTIAAALPTLLSLAIFPDWWHPLAVVLLFIGLELVSSNVFEPWLYASSTGLSSVAVLISAVFWTWLWGPIGLLLATPLTVCLVVAGRYVGQLEFLSVLLGDEPVWDASSRFYQRLLAMDDEEAGQVLEEYLADHSLIATYDEVLLPALHLAEHDRHRGHLGADREEFINQSIEGLLDDLEESPAPLEEPADRVQEPEARADASNDRTAASNHKPGPARALHSAPPPSPPVNPPTVLCLPARDEADELVARIFASVLRRAGFPARVASVESLAGEMLDLVNRSQAFIVCISALPPAAISHSRYLCKRLRARFDKIKIVVGLWNAAGDLQRARGRLTCSGTDKIVRSLREALHEIRQFNVPQTKAASAPEGAI